MARLMWIPRRDSIGLILLSTQLATAEATISSNEVAAAHSAQVKELEQYLDKVIADSEKVRAKSWQRDFTSVKAYEKSILSKREDLWRLLGGKPVEAAPLAPK